MDDVLRLAVVLALIAGNAFFVIGEYAVVTARRGAMAAAAEAGRPGARAALRLMDDPVRVISTVQVGITALGILIGAIGEPLVREVLGEGIPTGVAFVLGFSIVTYLSVVLGELVPKALTLHNPERLAALVAPPVELLAAVLRPFVWLLQGSAQTLLRPFGVREVAAGETIRSPEELRALVDEAEGLGVIPTAQEELLHNVFDFPGREARDVMVPVADVVWLDGAISVETALDTVAEQPFSRYPVAGQTPAVVNGVVHVRELMAAARGRAGATVDSVARQVPIIPETKDLGALLRDLRERREHMAVVADEYGGTVGIVTLEDILEELVGEIEDEYDLPDDTLERVDERTVRVAGSMTVDDFREAVGDVLPETTAHTMAGVVFDALGHGPEVGDAVAVGDAELVVEELDGARITRLRVRTAAG